MKKIFYLLLNHDKALIFVRPQIRRYISKKILENTLHYPQLTAKFSIKYPSSRTDNKFPQI